MKDELIYKIRPVQLVINMNILAQKRVKLFDDSGDEKSVMSY